MFYLDFPYVNFNDQSFDIEWVAVNDYFCREYAYRNW